MKPFDTSFLRRDDSIRARHGMVWTAGHRYRYYYREDAHPTLIPTPAPENDMDKVPNTPVFEIKSFINGRDASEISDDEVFKEIARLEQQIEKLENIKSKPKKLEARIEELKKSISELVTYVDERP